MNHAEKVGAALLHSFFDEEGWPEADKSISSTTRAEVDSYWYLNFKTDNYDWETHEWTRKQPRGQHACRAIPIMMQRPGSKKLHDVVESGYFMVVSPIDYKRMTRFPDGSQKRWTLKVDRNKETGEIVKLYARRCGRGDEPRCVMAHRELLGCLYSKHVVDHFNGWGLDNCRPNLGHVTRSENVTNPSSSRRRKYNLPTGVEPMVRGGKVFFGGIRAERYGRKDPVTGRRKVRYIRSKRHWGTPDLAARWYQNQLKKKYGIRPWARNPSSVSYPSLPSKLESEPSKRSTRLRKKDVSAPPVKKAVPKVHVLTDVPF